jgi:hypothetical protein
LCDAAEARHLCHALARAGYLQPATRPELERGHFIVCERGTWRTHSSAPSDLTLWRPCLPVRETWARSAPSRSKQDGGRPHLLTRFVAS